MVSQLEPGPAPPLHRKESADEKTPRYDNPNLEAGDLPIDAIARLRIEEAEHDIKYRTLSWQKTALLLFGEYVCLAILALAWSWSVLGWMAGFFITFGMAIVTWYTSYLLWQWCMRHPEARDICDIAATLFPGRFSRIAYEFTAFMLLANNLLLIGFHVFTGAKIFNTMTGGGVCTVVFQAVTAILGFICSMPRTLNHVAMMSIVSATSMAIAILLSLIYCGIEDHPLYGYGGNWPSQGPVMTSIGLPGGGSGFVNGLNATLNITFLFIGQILYPTFIAEMKNPADFPKALAALTGMELVLFCITAAVGYHYLGQYSTAPVIGSLLEPWARKSAFIFVLIPTIVIGSIYSNIASKFVFNRILGKTRHAHSHTVVGWGSWVGIVLIVWIIAFVLGNVIPSMGDFLSLAGSLFDSFFGFLFWSCAYYHMNKGKFWASKKRSVMTIINIAIFCMGLFILGPGLYTSIEAIKIDYQTSSPQPFTCKNNEL